jgi:F-type H+-transporting ATPase subunit gamma
MANTRELRRRIKSVKNTAQITKAMEMVAATKMRRAQTQALAGRPYSSTLAVTLDRLAGKVTPEKNRLLQSNDSQKVGVILLTTDKSLCGALNTNVFRTVQQFTKGEIATGSSNPRNDVIASEAKQSSNLYFYTVGKKGRNFCVKTGKELVADFDNLDTVTFRQAKQLANLVIESFLKGEIGKAYVIFPDFVSTLRQEPKVLQLLPIDKALFNEIVNSKDRESTNQRTNEQTSNEFLFEPNPDILLDYILHHHIETQIYQALLETKASEHSARMIAMQNATNNAKDLVSDLNLTYNQTRQDAITRELLEITTAAAALE